MGKLSGVAKMGELVIVLILALVFVVSLGLKLARAETCYECGRRFVPSVHTPLRTRGWDKPFCSDGCKVDYRMGRI